MFTKKEQQIYDLMNKNLPNSEIVNILNTTKRAVKFHKMNIYRKLGKTGKNQTKAYKVDPADFLTERERIKQSYGNVSK